jgi:phosphoribosylformylglycinamidine synthase
VKKASKTAPASPVALKARVFVTLKRAVLDPQGKAVARSLGQLGFPEVADVRVGKLIELEVAGLTPSDARARLEKMCQALLANPVIEDYRIEIDA